MVWFGKTLKYVAFQISNILFQKKVGYFDPNFEGMPLLHSWSLGVEEQFYLIWPAILFLLFKLRKNHDAPFYGLIFISLFSLIFSQSLIIFDKEKLAFFSVFSRLFELGIGAIVAFDKIKHHSKIQNEILGFLGLGLITFSFFFIKSDNFPGLMALIPCLGAGLIIFSGINHQTFTKQILSNKILVFIGLISYSLYLWHWPLIVFYKEYFSIEQLFLKDYLIIIFLSFVIAFLSWKFIETPFRQTTKLREEKLLKFKIKKFTFKIYYPIAASLIAISFVSFIGFSIKKTHFEWREIKFANDDKSDILGQAQLDSIPSTNCLIKYDKKQTRSILNQCFIGNNKENFEVLIFGDSQAEHYSTAVIDWAQKKNFTVLMISGTGCPPLFNIKLQERDCSETQKTVLKILQKHKNIKYIFLAGRYSLYTNGTLPSFLLDYSDSKNKKSSATKAQKIFTDEFPKTIDKFKADNRKIIILGEIPSARNNKTLKREEKNKRLFLYRFLPSIKEDGKIATRSEYEQKVNFTHNIIRATTSKDKGLIFFDPINYFCTYNNCYYKKDGKIIYRDESHLNIYGGHYIGKYFNFQ